jgi:hypothetical protein
LLTSTLGSAIAAALFPIVFGLELNMILAAAFMGGQFGLFFGFFLRNYYA